MAPWDVTVRCITGLLRFYGLVLYSLAAESVSTEYKFTAKRACSVLTLLAAVPALIVWNCAGLLLDEVLFARLLARADRTEIVKPTFIIGNARSGTTWLHRLLVTSSASPAPPSSAAASSAGHFTGFARAGVDDDRGDDPSHRRRRYSDSDSDAELPPRFEFTSLRTWEILFAVSLSWKVLFYALFCCDRSLLGGLGLRLLLRGEAEVLYGEGGVALALLRALWGGEQRGRELDALRAKALHGVGLMEAEEDEWLMVHIGYSQLITLFFPLGMGFLGDVIQWRGGAEPAAAGEVDDVDVSDCDSTGYSESTTSTSSGTHREHSSSSSGSGSGGSGGGGVSAATKRFILLFYRGCVLRHLVWKRRVLQLEPRDTSTPTSGIATTSDGDHPQQRQQLVYVSKNPAFTLRIPDLYDAFSDCDPRVVCLLRDPAESIPSMVSYIAQVWRVSCSPQFAYPSASTLFGFCTQHYLYPLEHLNVIVHPDLRQWAFVHYADLLQHSDAQRKVFRKTMRALFARLYFGDTAFDGEDEGTGGSGAVVAGMEAELVRLVSNLEAEEARQRQVRLEASAARSSQTAGSSSHDSGARYQSAHQHSVGACCGMTLDEFKSNLTEVYRAHPRLRGDADAAEKKKK